MLLGPETTSPCRFLHQRRRTRPVGFTLIEAMVATSITAIAASALLLGVASALQTTDDAVPRTVAAGLARLLMDEVTGARYVDYQDQHSPYAGYLGPGADEQMSGTRELFDDVDDFNGFVSQPPVDPWGIAMGEDDGEGQTRHPHFLIPSGVLGNWRQEVTVYYVDPSSPTVPLEAGLTSDYRAVEVRIVCTEPDGRRRELARLHRIVAYVPPL